MEKNTPNDRLEEFLRKSLEAHSEDPPGDLWSKIEGDLEPPVVVQPKLVPMKTWWAVAAAAAVVALMLVGQHLYFSQKLNQMSKELEHNTNQLRQLEEEKKTVQLSTAPENTSAMTQEEAVEENDFENLNQTTTDKSGIGQSGRFQPKKSVNGTAKINVQHKKNKVIEPPKTEQTVPLNTLEQSENLVIGEENKPIEIQNIEATLIENQLEKEAELQPVWPKKLCALPLPIAPAPLANVIIPASKISGSGYAVGLNVMPMQSKIKMSGIRPMTQGPGGDRRDFKVERESTGQSLMAGVAVEKHVGRRFFFGTGADYRKVDYVATHELDLKFGDRDSHGMHNNEHQHDFQYNLNTAVGTVEMTVRAESSETAQQIPDNEKVEAEITTRQRLDYLSVPVYAGVNLGNGRLRMLAKAGVLFNFLTDNQLTVDPIKSLNPRFEFKRNDRQSGTPSDLQSVTLDYIAGVGLEYQLTNALSLRLEPTMIGSLTSRHNNPRIQSSEFSAGLNAGLMYNF